jgi:undecaprenyl-phosphate 4-deoxy-4-formamido-L-arabinose transferase
MSQMRTCSVVVPVYNSQITLPQLIDELAKVLPTLCQQYEVILVNDASRDDSWLVIEKLTDKHDWVRGIHLMRNYGQHNALLCGIRAARYEIIITMDDDLQHPPQMIEHLLTKLDEGYDVVYGTPHQEQHGLWRDFASQITKLALQSAMGVEVARKVSAFRVFRTQLRAAFENYRASTVSIDVLLTWGTTRFAAIPVEHQPRRLGQSNYTFWKLFTHALNMVTGFSVLPLQIASLLGFFFTLFGMVVLVYVVGRFLIQGSVVQGFPFLASIISIFSGVQLFALGIIGEYLARIHLRAQDRPAYTIREQVGKQE